MVSPESECRVDYSASMRIMCGGSSTASRRRNSAQRPAHRGPPQCRGWSTPPARAHPGRGPLDHGFHRHFLVAQRCRHIGNDSRPIQDHQADIVGAAAPVHRRGGTAQARGRHAEGRPPSPARDIDDIRDHRRSGRAGAGAAAFEHVRRRNRPDHHRVEDAVDMGDGRALADRPDEPAARCPWSVDARDAEQLDPIAEIVGVADIVARDVLDAFDMDAGEIDLAAEGERGQYRELMGGIEAADVEGRVGLGIAQLCASASTSAKSRPALAHLGQDVIAGAVEDAIDPPRCRCRPALPAWS